jgi:hypothetical protein
MQNKLEHLYLASFYQDLDSALGVGQAQMDSALNHK